MLCLGSWRPEAIFINWKKNTFFFLAWFKTFYKLKKIVNMRDFALMTNVWGRHVIFLNRGSITVLKTFFNSRYVCLDFCLLGFYRSNKEWVPSYKEWSLSIFGVITMLYGHFCIFLLSLNVHACFVATGWVTHIYISAYWVQFGNIYTIRIYFILAYAIIGPNKYNTKVYQFSVLFFTVSY